MAQIDIDRRLCIAPMLDWTDRHYRFLMRLITHRTLLYTEMVTTGAILHGDVVRHLWHHPAEAPVALQLGGSDPAALAHCVRVGEAYGYAEFNLNVGCPSDRVQSGMFGACLMARPDLVAECIAAMREATASPITVKHRLGIDDLDSYEALTGFVATVSAAGCRTFIVHARKAWLKGLSPKQNREIPPLQYEAVHRLKRDFPELEIIINGGFKTLNRVRQQLEQVDGVMIGREAYQNPWLLADADRQLYAEPDAPRTRRQVIHSLLGYVEEELAKGTRLYHITRHMLGLFQGQPGGRAWRRHLSQQAHLPQANGRTIEQALAHIPDDVLDGHQPPKGLLGDQGAR